MKKTVSVLQALMTLPPVWLALLAVTAAALTNEPVMDILRYALWRLGLAG